MNEGISFDEACRLTPQSLTEVQRQNCQLVQNSLDDGIIYIFSGVVILLMLFAVTIMYMKKQPPRPKP